jgi:hypothetical protein
VACRSIRIEIQAVVSIAAENAATTTFHTVRFICAILIPDTL